MPKLLKWKKLAKGGVIEKAGNSVEYLTGGWGPNVVRWNKKTCINCRQCFTVCPDGCILIDKKGNMAGVDKDHCKECGLCIEICPTKPKSLIMEKEKIKSI